MLYLPANSRAERTEPLRWLVCCDESGIDGKRFYGFGSLWMKEQRRGEIQRDVRAIRERHKYVDEFKWNKVRLARLPFYRDIIDYFFDNTGLCFHCLVVRKAAVDRSFHQGDWDLARRKHFTLLLTNKVGRALQVRRHRQQTFRIWVDPIASRYKKADEAVHIIGNNVLRARAVEAIRGSLKAETEGPIVGVHEHDSRDTPQIQLCDLLLGAVMDAWQENATEPGKLAVKAHISKRLGWPDLKADTRPGSRRFNVWYFNPTPSRREVASRHAL